MGFNGKNIAAIDTNHARTGTKMRAIVQDSYGSADVLRSEQIDPPRITDHEVLLRVHAAGLDRGTWHLMTGTPYLMRIIGFGFRKPKNRVPGIDVAGTVVAVGSAVTRFAVGDEVFGMSRGSFAEYAAAREDKLAHKPANASFEQAATRRDLRRHRTAGPDGRRAAGRTTGVDHRRVRRCRQLRRTAGQGRRGGGHRGEQHRKADLVTGLGADHVVDYTREDFADGVHQYDLIIDIAGNSPLSRLRRALTPTGTAVIVGGESKGNVTGGIDRQLRAMILTRFIGQRLTGLASKERASDRKVLADHLAAGTVTPSIDRAYPLDQVPAAMRHLAAGKVQGKLAITI